MIIFAENFKKLRKEKGMTQERIGEQLNVSREAVAHWESGDYYPDIEKMAIIAEFFEVTIDELVKSKNDFIRNNNLDVFSQLHEMKNDVKNILKEIAKIKSDKGVDELIIKRRNRGIEQNYDAYDWYNSGVEFWGKYEYVDAVINFEKALGEGSFMAGLRLIEIHQQLLKICDSDFEYLEELLEFSRLIQNYGKLMEVSLRLECEEKGLDFIVS